MLLRLIGNTTNHDIIRSCVQNQSEIYISSQKWRDENPAISSNQVIHGPCTSGAIGSLEYDLAYCLKSDKFPKAAICCIKRLYERGWPSSQVLHDIVRGGCSLCSYSRQTIKLSTLRMAFIVFLCRETLIHALNHTQFYATDF